MKKYILYAEDDPEDFEVLKSALEEVNNDITLVQVPTGYDVIKYLQDLDPSQYPSLILMDLNMPLLDGRETLKLLKIDDQYKTIPVKVFSTVTSPTDKIMIEQTGSEVIKKPAMYAGWLSVASKLAKYCCVLLMCSIMR